MQFDSIGLRRYASFVGQTLKTNSISDKLHLFLKGFVLCFLGSDVTYVILWSSVPMLHIIKGQKLEVNI